MVKLCLFWVAIFAGCIYSKGNTVAVFCLGFLSGLMYGGWYIVTTYDLTLKSSHPSEITAPSGMDGGR